MRMATWSICSSCRRSRATLYQRATGYFSGNVLALAARGLDALIAKGGKMQLLVGCTLTPDDVEQIQKGYDVREHAARTGAIGCVLETESPQARKNLGDLAWLIAHGHLDVKLAIPLDENGEMRAGLGLYHAKAGIITDHAGDKLAFKGSINETHSRLDQQLRVLRRELLLAGRVGPKENHEDRGGVRQALVRPGEVAPRVFDFPDALKAKLLEFLPADDVFVKPPDLVTATATETAGRRIPELPVESRA